MCYERVCIYINRIAAIAAIVISVIVMVAIFVPKPGPALINEDGYIDSYYESPDSITYYKVVLEFNKKVEEVIAEVSFYDADGNLLDTQTETFFRYSDRGASYIFRVDGKVSYYLVDGIFSGTSGTSNKVQLEEVKFIITALYCFLFVWFVFSFMQSYEEYEYNGHYILVYTGLVKHYIRIDGKKVDEYKKISISDGSIMGAILENGEVMDVTVVPINKVSVKINNRPLSPIKTKSKGGKHTDKNVNDSAKKTDIDNIPNENNCITNNDKNEKDIDIGSKNM